MRKILLCFMLCVAAMAASAKVNPEFAGYY